jgi:nitrite reductase/ring-hydroxylating ferredoxin subunit
MRTIDSSQRHPTSPTERVGTIDNGGFLILRDFALARETADLVRARLLDGVEQLEGRECRERVERDGLAKLHHHFPVAKVIELRVFAMKEVRFPLLRLAHSVGSKELGLRDTFYVDDYTALRLNYPYVSARKGPMTIDPPSVGDTLDPHEAENVQLPVGPRTKVKRLLRRALSRVRRGPELPQYDIGRYHKGLPPPAWAHGPHIDTWYGHPAKGINLWWSITGTCEDNGLVFYPGLYGTDVEADPRSMFIKEGFALTEPHKLNLRDGEALIFNGEALHSTHLNVADLTRVAFTTRICAELPTFLPGRNPAVSAGAWHRSDDLARGMFRRVVSFPKMDRLVPLPSYRHAPRRSEARKQLQVDQAIGANGPVRVCASAELGPGAMMNVRLSNANLLLIRDGGGVHALSARCPHLGLELVDGTHADGQLYCPGHGVAFELATGKSKCSELQLAVYDATERDGFVFVGKRDAAE